MRTFGTLALGLMALFLLAPAVYAQDASIAGLVKDTSGSVLPGVTVEVSSPALIEKVRTVVTDGTGQYKVVSLRPGAYTVAFTLPGFNTVRRTGIELTGSFTATVDETLMLGAVEETITVTSAVPIVDLQSATKERVFDSSLTAQIPTSRSITMATFIPGVSTGTGELFDVGGTSGSASVNNIVAHGSQNNSMRITANGLLLSTSSGKAAAPPNIGAAQEVRVDYAAVDASASTGGVRMEFVPREGGNRFSGSGFASFANSSMQGNNFTQRLRDLGFKTPSTMDKVWDVNPGVGGPILVDRLWFYATVRQMGAYTNVPLFHNLNADNLNAWTYAPDTSRPAKNQRMWSDVQARFTWQATPRNKLSGVYNANSSDTPTPWSSGSKAGIRASTTSTPEATTRTAYPIGHWSQLDWTSPITSRFLITGGVNERYEQRTPVYDFVVPGMISVIDQGGAYPNVTYRAPATRSRGLAESVYYQVALTYVTGSHEFKVGLTGAKTSGWEKTFTDVPYSYRFNNGIPNQITVYATPYQIKTAGQGDIGIYAQDKWTTSRLTLGYGLRFDYFANTIPENVFGPGPLAPTRNVTFPAQPNLNWKDLGPRFSAVYDVFGTGKTALKVSLNKYFEYQQNAGLATAPGRASNVITTATRAWTDNGNFFPDCNLLNPAANGECGGLSNAAFGTAVPGQTYDQDLLRGWGKRGYNWEFSTGIQREISPQVSIDVSYFRRWFGNFLVTDNQAVVASDYTGFSLIAPTNPRLPNGGGGQVAGLFDLNPNKFGVPTQNYVTHSKNFGKQIQHWNGFDVSANMRFPGQLVAQGGVSVGRTATDNCAVVASLPETLISGSTVTPASYCHADSGWVSQVKFLGSYTIPKIRVQTGLTFQSIQGPALAANFVASNAVVAPSLGRNLSGGANATVNLIAPGTLYGDRLNEFDFRIGRPFSLGKFRVSANVDLYNVFNSDAVLSEQSAYTSWRTPLSTINPRFAKVSLQWDF